ncbi:MAG TPA: alpha/beta hydrolase [Actinomycetota bacterium]|nr:alpha/beta hydrolase [Actinomycetota bacterium]
MGGSLVTGLAVGLFLATAGFVPAEEGRVTGALLCGSALGWAMLAILSARFSDQPQRWAAVPALFMGSGGLLLLGFGSSAHGVLKWVWPPALLVLAVWMIIHSRRQLRSGSRWLLYPVFAALLLASVGGVYETVSEATDADAFPMAGQLIDVGGHSLHLRCTGSGSPTVVLEPGAGLMSSALGWIEPAVARDTRVCVYDRAGRGWSEPADTPQDATQIATDLHTLVARGDVPGPYVLAGHSFGGLYVLTFAALYPDDVAGMVLVDSTAPASAAPPAATSRGDGRSDDVLSHVSALLSSSARLGVGRLLARSDYFGLPPRSQDELRASAATADHLKSTIDEYIQANASTSEAATLSDFGDKPLVVLTAGVGSDPSWMTAQDRLATLSSNSDHRVVDGAVHVSLLYDEHDAAVTTQAILDVLSSVRSGDPLVP